MELAINEKFIPFSSQKEYQQRRKPQHLHAITPLNKPIIKSWCSYQSQNMNDEALRSNNPFHFLMTPSLLITPYQQTYFYRWDVLFTDYDYSKDYFLCVGPIHGNYSIKVNGTLIKANDKKALFRYDITTLLTGKDDVIEIYVYLQQGAMHQTMSAPYIIERANDRIEDFSIHLRYCSQKQLAEVEVEILNIEGTPFIAYELIDEKGYLMTSGIIAHDEHNHISCQHSYEHSPYILFLETEDETIAHPIK